MVEPVIAVHGGAGRPRAEARDWAAHEAGLRAALATGHGVLQQGGKALDAVDAAVCSLEDDPLFNAGHGSVLGADGAVEMDASIMCGASGAAGAVGAVRRVRHPIAVARALLDEGGPVMMAGAACEALARERGVELCADEDLVTAAQRERWRERRDIGQGLGTVGAVALDERGDLAAATSTGGTRLKRPGRLGDSALIGAGTWADNETCAVSCTGNGEGIIRVVAAHEVASLVAHAGRSLDEAASEVVERLGRLGVDAGLVAVDSAGAVTMPANCGLMYRGLQRGAGPPSTAVVADRDSE